MSTDSKTLRILFLGGAKRVSMGQKFIEAGRRLGYDVELFSYELSPFVAIASIAKVIIGRKWSDQKLLEDLHEVVTENSIDILIPFVDGAVAIAADYCRIYGDAWAPTGSAELSAAMFDKIEADRLFRELGLPVPANDSYPKIAKPRFGSASKGIVIFDTPEKGKNLTASDYLIQNYISRRKEITVDCYVTLAGKIISTVSRERIETQGGEATVTETFRNDETTSLAVDTLRKTGLRGAVTIQMIRDLATGRLMLMEINPRLGGGAVCSCHAGADLPEFILKDYLGMEIAPCDTWEAGVRICRYLAEVAFHTSSDK